jgi:putative ABC transport system substrate-binding protein
MRRRDFIRFAGGAAAGWPLAVRAQQGERVRRVAVLIGEAEGEVSRSNLSAFRGGLEALGWVVNRNLRIEVRFGSGDVERMRASAAELVSLAPDVIVPNSAAATRSVQEYTSTIPIVFAAVGDPIANGIVKNVSHPEGNTTGYTGVYASIGGRWLQLLKEAVPRIQRVGVVYNAGAVPDDPSYGYFPSINEAAGALTVQAIRIGYRDAVDLVHAIDDFGAQPNGGLIVMPPAPIDPIREAIRRLAAQHRLPAIYQSREFAAEGGLMSYGVSGADIFRRAAAYVDRVLRGAKVSDLPVENATRFELIVNLKTAKAIGLTIPESFLARADEVIE